MKGQGCLIYFLRWKFASLYLFIPFLTGRNAYCPSNFQHCAALSKCIERLIKINNISTILLRSYEGSADGKYVST